MWALLYARLIYGFLGRGDICVSIGSFDVSVYVAVAESPLPPVFRCALSVTQLEKTTMGGGVHVHLHPRPLRGQNVNTTMPNHYNLKVCLYPGMYCFSTLLNMAFLAQRAHLVSG